MLEVRPLVVADGVVVGGNMRLLVMKDLGYKEVPAIDVSEWTQAERDEFMIKDNTHFGSWDYDALANEWDTLPLTEWGVAVWDTEVEDVKGLTDEDEVPEAPQEPITKLGDVWILGEHRVMCGDNIKLMQNYTDNKFTTAIVDPPYGLDIAKSGSLGRDKFEPKEWDSEIPSDCYFEELFRVSSNQVICGGNYFPYIWNKGGKEFIFWNKLNHHSNRADGELIWTSFNGLAKYFEYMWDGNRYGFKEEIKGVGKKSIRVHPTQKPIELYLMLLKNYTEEGSIVLDTHLGSGSTLIAAEKTNRKCYGMELDPKYCDVIVKRWEDFTGKKATREIDELEVITQAN
jgi:DNA modification methylase